MKKLNSYEAKIIKEIIREGNSAFELEGKKYQLISLESSITTVKEDIEKNTELEQKLQQSKKDILHNRVYSTDEILEMIEQGEL